MKTFYFIYIFFRYISREKIEKIGHYFNALKVSNFSPSTLNTYEKTSNGPLGGKIFNFYHIIGGEKFSLYY